MRSAWHNAHVRTRPAAPLLAPAHAISQHTQWMSDKTAKNCCACGFQFNLLVRRHHCR